MAQNVLMAEVAQAMNIKPVDPGFCFNGVLRGRLVLWPSHQQVRWSHFKGGSPVCQMGRKLPPTQKDGIKKGMYPQKNCRGTALKVKSRIDGWMD